MRNYEKTIIDPFGVIKDMVKDVQSRECPTELREICLREAPGPKETVHHIHHIWIGGKATDERRQGIWDAGKYCKITRGKNPHAHDTAIYWVYKGKNFSDEEYDSLLKEAKEHNFKVFDIRHILKMALNEPDDTSQPKKADILKEIARQVLYHINAREFINAADIFRLLALYYCGGLYLDHEYIGDLEELVGENIFSLKGKSGCKIKKQLNKRKNYSLVLLDCKDSNEREKIITSSKKKWEYSKQVPLTLICENANSNNSRPKWFVCGLTLQNELLSKKVKQTTDLGSLLSQYKSTGEIPKNSVGELTHWMRMYLGDFSFDNDVLLFQKEHLFLIKMFEQMLENRSMSLKDMRKKVTYLLADNNVGGGFYDAYTALRGGPLSYPSDIVYQAHWFSALLFGSGNHDMTWLKSKTYLKHHGEYTAKQISTIMLNRICIDDKTLKFSMSYYFNSAQWTNSMEMINWEKVADIFIEKKDLLLPYIKDVDTILFGKYEGLRIFSNYERAKKLLDFIADNTHVSLVKLYKKYHYLFNLKTVLYLINERQIHKSDDIPKPLPLKVDKPVIPPSDRIHVGVKLWELPLLNLEIAIPEMGSAPIQEDVAIQDPIKKMLQFLAEGNYLKAMEHFITHQKKMLPRESKGGRDYPMIPELLLKIRGSDQWTGLLNFLRKTRFNNILYFFTGDASEYDPNDSAKNHPLIFQLVRISMLLLSNNKKWEVVTWSRMISICHSAFKEINVELASNNIANSHEAKFLNWMKVFQKQTIPDDVSSDFLFHAIDLIHKISYLLESPENTDITDITEWGEALNLDINKTKWSNFSEDGWIQELYKFAFLFELSNYYNALNYDEKSSWIHCLIQGNVLRALKNIIANPNQIISYKGLYNCVDCFKNLSDLQNLEKLCAYLSPYQNDTDTSDINFLYLQCKRELQEKDIGKAIQAYIKMLKIDKPPLMLHFDPSSRSKIKFDKIVKDELEAISNRMNPKVPNFKIKLTSNLSAELITLFSDLLDIYLILETYSEEYGNNSISSLKSKFFHLFISCLRTISSNVNDDEQLDAICQEAIKIIEWRRQSSRVSSSTNRLTILKDTSRNTGKLEHEKKSSSDSRDNAKDNSSYQGNSC